ncbi:hypothetical protein BpHYR1_001320 [Brachionus plicatilis]|uniref:Uncharacterized protein n=1 Tax=Brachionus plicatilis TaxID=10195 RepID=A0A3M7T7A8_BRAPC|nr:hypothetical protein BpHYR1_001320 [Brachionus plicatilis]
MTLLPPWILFFFILFYDDMFTFLVDAFFIHILIGTKRAFLFLKRRSVKFSVGRNMPKFNTCKFILNGAVGSVEHD